MVKFLVLSDSTLKISWQFQAETEFEFPEKCDGTL